MAKMKLAMFRCCVTSLGLSEFETATSAVLKKLGVEFADSKDFNCCGYPLRNYNFKAYILCSARNWAVAEEKNVNILTGCNCCFGSLKRAEHSLSEDTPLREEINKSLRNEGLAYTGKIRTRHVLEVFHDDLGVDHIRGNVVNPFSGLKIAAHYGCHLLRPQSVVGFDRSLQPSKLDRLVEATGASVVSWQTKLDCCGSPLLGVNDELSKKLTERKLRGARDGGADLICTACPYCQIQFDRMRKTIKPRFPEEEGLRSMLYAQLLGLSLGLEPEELGMSGEGPVPAVEDQTSCGGRCACM
jgi:heterodisulfide reductase subunit B